MKMKNFNIRKFIVNYYKAITFFIILLILCLGYFFILKDKWQNIRKMQITVLENTESEFEVTKNSYLKLKKSTSNFDILSRERFTKLKEILPYKKDLPVLYLQIMQVMENLGLEAIDLNISEDGADVALSNFSIHVKEIQIKLNFKNPLDYISLKNLLSRIYSQTPLLNIKSIDIKNVSYENSEKGFDTGSNSIQKDKGDLILYTYYIEEEQKDVNDVFPEEIMLPDGNLPEFSDQE